MTLNQSHTPIDGQKDGVNMVVYVLADGCRVIETNKRTFGEFAATLAECIAEHGEIVDIQWA